MNLIEFYFIKNKISNNSLRDSKMSSNTFRQNKIKYYSFIYHGVDNYINIIFVGNGLKHMTPIFDKISKTKSSDNLGKKELEEMNEVFGKGFMSSLNIHDYVDIIYFDKRFVINDDDTIESITQKIIYALFDMGYTNDKNTLLLWCVENNKVNMINFDYYNKNKFPMLGKHPFMEIKGMLEKNNYEFELEKEILNNQVKFVNHSEYIFYDFYLTKTKKFFCTDLNSVLKYLYNFNFKINNDKITNYLLHKYFPNMSSNTMLKLLQNKRTYSPKINMSDINDNKKKIIDEQETIDYLYDVYDNDFKYDYYILSCFLQVNEDNDNTENFIELNKIFNMYNPRLLSNDIKYILITDVDYNGTMNNIVKINKNYFNNEIIKNDKLRKNLKEELLKEHKKNKVSFKFSVIDDTETSINFQIKSNGFQKIFITWNEEQKSDLKNLNTSVKYVSKFIVNLNEKNIFSHRLRRIEPPKISNISEFITTSQQSNTHIINIKYNISFKLKVRIDFDILEKIIEMYDTHASVLDNNEILIEKIQMRSDSNIIINRLKQQNLFNVTKLRRLSNSEWNKLKILDNQNQNKELISKLKKIISLGSRRELQFIYKRFSDYKTSKRINKIIDQFIINNNVNPQELYASMMDLKKNIDYLSKLELDEIVSNNEIINELNKKMDINITETIDRIILWYNSKTEHVERKSSMGIKCIIMETGTDNESYIYKTDIAGVKHFTSSFYYGNINELIKHVYLFIKKVIDIYVSYSKKSLDKKIVNKIKKTTVVHEETEIDTFVDYDFSNNDYIDNISELDLGNDDLISHFETKMDDITNDNKPMTNNNNNNNNIKIEDSNDVYLTKLDSLRKREPTLFVKKKGQKNSFAQNCSPVQRQPIILTKKEYGKLDTKKFITNKETPLGFNYRGYYYVCPDIFCPNSKNVMSEKDLTNRKYKTEMVSGNKIERLTHGTCPDGGTAILPDKGLIVNNDKLSEKELYRYPGFFDKSFHTDGICVPCCMKNDQSEEGRAKYGLFNECLFNKKKDSSDISKSQSKYVYKEMKKLGEDRLGFLNDALDSYLNNETECYTSNLIKDNGGCYLRYGSSNNNTLLNSIYKIYKLNRIHKHKKYDSFQEIRDKLYEYILADDQLYLSLNGGNLDYYVGFTNIISDKYTNKESYADLLKNYSHVKKFHLYDLLSRKLPFLFENGINLVIFKYGGLDDKIMLNCHKPSPNSKSKEYCYLFAFDDVTYEPVILNNGTSYESVFTEKMINKQILSEFNRCSVSKKNNLSIFELHDIITKLIDNGKLEKDYIIKYQIYDEYNKVFGVVLRNGLFFPLDLNEIYVDKHIKEISIKDFSKIKLLNIENTYKYYMKIANLLPSNFKKAWDINKILVGTLGIFYGFRTKNDKIVFYNNVKDLKNKFKDMGIKKTDNLLDMYDDSKGYVGEVSYYDKLYISKHNDYVYQRLRHEFHKFLSAETREDKKVFYIIVIINILNSHYSVREKRNIMYNLFFNGIDNLKPLNDILISGNTTNKTIITNNKFGYSYCKNHKNKESCNKDNFCDFYNNSCKFYLRSTNEHMYIYYLIEELISLPNKKEELLYTGIVEKINTSNNNKYYIIDKISFINILQIIDLSKRKNEFGEIFNKAYLKNYDLLKNKNNLVKIEDDTDKLATYYFIKNQLIPNLQSKFSHIRYNKFNGFLGSMIESKYALININYGHLYDLIYFIIYTSRSFKKKEETPEDIKYKVKNIFNKNPKIWHSVLNAYQKKSPIYNGITKYVEFLELFVSDKHLGYNEDLILIQDTYDINIVLININASNVKNSFICFGKEEKLDISKKFVLLGFSEPNKYSVVCSLGVNKTLHSVYDYENLPKFIIDNLNF